MFRVPKQNDESTNNKAPRPITDDNFQKMRVHHRPLRPINPLSFTGLLFVLDTSKTTTLCRFGVSVWTNLLEKFCSLWPNDNIEEQYFIILLCDIWSVIEGFGDQTKIPYIFQNKYSFIYSCVVWMYSNYVNEFRRYLTSWQNNVYNVVDIIILAVETNR